MPRSPAIFGFLLACSSDGGLKTYNTPPQVEITSPTDGQAFHAADSVSIATLVDDSQTPNAKLTYAFGSSLDGPLPGEPEINEVGALLIVSGLSAGEHELIVKVIDGSGESGEARTGFSVAENLAPTVTFLSPASGATSPLGGSVHVQVAAADDYETNLSGLGVTFSGLPDLTGVPTALNADGTADFYLTGLALGAYSLAVVVTDPLGEPGSASIAFEVVEPDIDGDGYLDATLGGDDCNDGDAAINPGAYERCDGVDNDCDGNIDEGDALDADVYYADNDGDGFGDGYAQIESCEALAGYVENANDCDDDEVTVNPDAPEFCNDIDDDCDGTADDGASDTTTWYLDVDGDGYGTGDTTRVACDSPGGYVANGDDCNDANASISPGTTETCNGRDDNCDGAIDEDTAADAATWYVDADSDAYGDALITDIDCEQPSGYVSNDDDCDDTDAGVSPADTEYCDGEDDDCDGTVDDDPADAPTYYADSDGDTYGDASSSMRACTQPADYVTNTSDCDDTDATVSPLATEMCDSIDNDCDGTTDEASAADALTWYRDADTDTFGSTTNTTPGCTLPAGYVADNTDCNDSSAAIYPGAADTFYDGIDSDCAGDDDYDADGDGWASDAYSGEDCDDTDASRYPGSATWSVPGDSVTIQGAIDLACTRDIIEVAAGEYVENVDYGAKAVEIIGAGADVTTIDGDFDGYPAVTMSGGTLEGFTVTNGLAPNGGGIYLFNADDAALTDLVVNDNWATTYGGGAYVLNSGEVVVDGCEFSENQAGNYGGGFAFYGYRSGAATALTMSDTVIEGNTLTSGGSGQGLYYYATSSQYAYFTEVDLLSNSGNGSGGGGYLYGYIDWTGGSASGNRASYDGGIFAQGYISFTDVDLTGNYAGYYGGGYFYGYNAASSISDVRVSGNFSSYYLLGLEGTLTASEIVVEDNYASYYLLNGNGTQVWENVSVRGNVVYQYLVRASATFDFTDLDIRDNVSSSTSADYPALYLYGAGFVDDTVVADNVGMTGVTVAPSSTSAEISLTNSTIVGNTYHGIYASPSWVRQVDIRNTLIAHNGGYGIYDTHSTFDPVVEYSDVYDNDDGDYTGMTDPTGSDGNVSVEPDFSFYDADIDSEYWDLHLDASSVLLDAGDPSVTDTDGTASDIGAYSGDGYSDDLDGDGLADGWESAWGVGSYDDSDDPDADGLTQAEELAAGTDPLDDDTDGDGVTDGDELLAGSDPLVPDHETELYLYGTSGLYVGYYLGFPGDVDGDGDDDILVGTNSYGYLVDGTVTGSRLITDVDDVTFSINGYSLVPAGDLDGDGRGDIAWSYPYSSGGYTYAMTSPFSASDSYDVSWVGENSSDYAGITIAALGDTDGDGLDDLLIGAYANDDGGTEAGAAYIVDDARSNGIALSGAMAKLTGESTYDYAGMGVSGPGDINGDGIADVLVGAYDSPGGRDYEGAAYLSYSPVSGTVDLGDSDVILVGAAGYDYAGIRSSAGDFDGDGNRDLLIAAPYGGGYTGKVHIVLGPPVSGSLADSEGTWTGNKGMHYLGQSLSGADDMDGDGMDDFVIGAPYVEGYTGEAYICLGPGLGAHTPDDAAVRLAGTAINDYLGYSVAGGGDVDSDGLGDVLIGAMHEDSNGSDAGAVYLITGDSL